VPWRRILAESVLIVASILLALAADAWWDSRGNRARERVLLGSMVDEFEASRPLLQDRVVLTRMMVAGNEALLELARTAGAAPIAVPDSLVISVLGGPTYEPTLNSLDAAMASGDIELIRSTRLRTELADWRRRLADTTEDELEVRRITNEQVVPLLGRSVSLAPYFARVLPWSEGETMEGADPRGVPTQLVMSSELVGVLSLRLFYARFAAVDLEELLASLDGIVVLLEDDLDP